MTFEAEIFSRAFRTYTGITAAICCLFWACLAFYLSKNDRTIRYFILSNLTLGLWNAWDLLTTNVPANWALVVDRLSYLFALLVVPSFFLLLISVSSDNDKPLRIPRILVFAILFFSSISFTPFLIREVKVLPKFEEVPGPLYPLFIVYFLSWLIYGLYRMYRAYKGVQGLKKNQLKYFLLALIVAFVAAINYFVYMFVPSFPPLFHLLEIFYTLLVGFAVIRFRLMDFNLLVRMGLAYGATAVSFASAFLGVLYVVERVSEAFHMTPGIASIFGVMAAFLVYETWSLKLRAYLDQFIYQSPDMSALLQQINTSISNSKSIEELASNLCEKVKGIWKVEHAGLVAWDPGKSEFDPLPSNQFQSFPMRKMNEHITQSDFLIKTLESERRLFHYGVVLDDDLMAYSARSFPGERMTFQKIRRSMRWLGAAVCVPVMNQGRLVAFLVMGEKKNGTLYNKEDKKILSHVGEMLGSVTLKFLYHSA